MRLDLEKLGTVVVVLATIVTLASLGVYTSLKMSVTDLHDQANILRADVPQPLTAGVALAGMLSALLSGQPALKVAQARDARPPLANPSINGSV